MKTLIYGYGNPGRQDDALANLIIERIEKERLKGNFPQVDTDSNYQLNIEDAELISNYDRVIFVDASTEDIDDIKFTRVEPSDAKVEFTMHAVSPAFVLDLCRKLYGRQPEVYLLHIRGYEWDFMLAPSGRAKENLEKAYTFLKEWLQK